MTRKASPRPQPLPAAITTALVALLALSLAPATSVATLVTCSDVALSGAQPSTPPLTYTTQSGISRGYWCPSPGPNPPSDCNDDPPGPRCGTRIPDGNKYRVPALVNPPNDGSNTKYKIEIFKDPAPNGPNPTVYPTTDLVQTINTNSIQAANPTSPPTELIALSGGGASDGSKTCGAYQVWYTPNCDTSRHIFGFRYIITDRIDATSIQSDPAAANQFRARTVCGGNVGDDYVKGKLLSSTYEGDCEADLVFQFNTVCQNTPSPNQVETKDGFSDATVEVSADVLATWTPPDFEDPEPCPGAKVTLPAYSISSYTINWGIGSVTIPATATAAVTAFLAGNSLTYVVQDTTTTTVTIGDPVNAGTAPPQFTLPADRACTPTEITYTGQCKPSSGNNAPPDPSFTITPTDSGATFTPIAGTLNYKATSTCDTTGTTLEPASGARVLQTCTTKLTYPAATFKCDYTGTPADRVVPFYAQWTAPTKPAASTEFCPGGSYPLSSIEVSDEFVTQADADVVLPPTLVVTTAANPFQYTLIIDAGASSTHSSGAALVKSLALDDCLPHTATYVPQCIDPDSTPPYDGTVTATASDSESATDPDVKQCGTEFTTRCKTVGQDATKGNPTLTGGACVLSVPLKATNACGKQFNLDPYTNNVCTCPTSTATQDSANPVVPPVAPTTP